MTDDALIVFAYSKKIINPLEYDVLMYRFDEVMTYKEIAHALNISINRAYQIKDKALRIMRDTGYATTVENEARQGSRLRRALRGEKRV